MNEPVDDSLIRGMVVIVGVGLALGVGFNALGQKSRPAWGLPWIGEDRVAALETIGAGAPADDGATAASSYNGITDPMAVGVAAGASDLPEIPVLDRPVQIQIDALRKYVDARAAVLIDAREPDEYTAGRIPGAISMPYDEVSAEPERLERLDAGGRPIVVYCGGGACELSLDLAWDLISAGQTRVVVYMGGFPEWEQAGLAIESGPPAGA